MAREYVIKFSAPNLPGATHLDYNNGFVYDAAGNQIAKLSPKDASAKEIMRQKMVASYVSTEAQILMRAAYDSPRESVRELRAALSDATNGQLVAMDLGTSDVHQPSPLPNYAAGYRNEVPMADMASPPLLADQISGKYYTFDKDDAYQLAEPTVGAPAGSVPEVAARLANNTYTTTEYALGGFVATELEAAADAPLRLRQATSKRILNALLMRREQRVATLLQNSANWNSGNVATVAAGYQWDGGANSDPISDIHARMESSLGNITGMILSERLWHAFQRNPNVQKYFTYKNGTAPMPDSSVMSSILELPKIYVAKMKYKSAASTYSYIWGNHVVFIRQPDQMPPSTQDDIASSYTFRWKAAQMPDGVVQGGFFVREFFNQVRGTKGGTQLVVGHHDQEVMTSGFAGGLLLQAWQ